MSLTLTSAPVRLRAPARLGTPLQTSLYQSSRHQPSRHELAAVSPLVIADRLITLAEEADRAGYRATASHLVELAYNVFDEARVH